VPAGAAKLDAADPRRGGDEDATGYTACGRAPGVEPGVRRRTVVGVLPAADEARAHANVRKRKVTYPTPRNKKPPVATDTPEPVYVRPTVVTIESTARAGRTGLTVGDRVRIVGSGLYNGEAAVIESLPAGGVIPSAMVRTEAGRTRRVRTIDLERLTAEG
jgi:hypothetical protein